MDVESEGETGEGTSFEYFEPADVKYPKVDVESKADTGEGMSLEYFEPADVKYSPEASTEGTSLESFEPADVKYPPPLSPESLKPLEENESGPSQCIGSESGTTPRLLDFRGSRSWALRLTGLNEKQQKALLNLGMTNQKGSADRVPFRLKELQERKRKTSSEPGGVPLQNAFSGIAASQLGKTIPSNTAKRRRTSAEPISEKLPGYPVSAVTSRWSGWNVETIGGQHFMPCPECKNNIAIEGRYSLIDHINESHPEKNWGDELRNRWHCQLCPRSKINRNLLLYEVFDHMCNEHKINLEGSAQMESIIAKDITCPDCQMQSKTKGTNFENARALLDHLKTAHGRRWNRRNKNVWMVLDGHFVKCKECVDMVKISGLTNHFERCHTGEKIDGGFCGRCNQRVHMKDLNTHMRDLRAHLHCAGPPKDCANNPTDAKIPDAV